MQGKYSIMISVSYIHRVGKSFFCKRVQEPPGIEYYSVGHLLTKRRHKGLSADKLVPNIDDNHLFLIDALQELRNSDRGFILDSHFCPLNTQDEITRIPLGTYFLLMPDQMMLFTEDPFVITSCREQKDGVKHDITEIESFQREGKSHAKVCKLEYSAYGIISRWSTAGHRLNK